MLTGPPPKFHGTRDILRFCPTRKIFRSEHNCGYGLGLLLDTSWCRR
jgi:hypothetical protein